MDLCKSNNKLIEVGRLVENFHTLNVLDMVDENITKIEYSSENIVHLMHNNDHMGGWISCCKQ